MNAPTLAAILVVLGAVPEPDDSHRTVVTPSRGGTTSEFDVDRSVHLVDEDTIVADQLLDGVDAAATAPGVFAQRTNRGAGAPLVRGLIGPQNLIVVDGVRYNQSTFRTGPNQYAALLSPMVLRGAEVVLGPGSVLYGASAMGGTLHYLTLRPPRRDGPMLKTTLRFASADLAAETAVLAGGRVGRFAGWAGGSIRYHDRLRVGGGAYVPVSSYVQNDWHAHAELDLDGGWKLESTWLGGMVVDAGRVDQLGKGQIRLYDNLDQLAYWRAVRTQRDSWLRELSVTASYHRLAERVDRFECPKDDAGSVADRDACIGRAPEDLTKMRIHRDVTQTVGLQLTADMRLFDDLVRIFAGVEGYGDFVASSREDAKSPDFVWEDKDRGSFSDGSTALNVDGFLFAEGRPWSDVGTFELVLEAGARVSHHRASAPDVPGVGDVEYSHTGPVFGAGVRALLFGHTNVYFSWAQGFRAPNLQETTVLGDTGNNFEIPNGKLGPERNDTIEVGVRLHLPWVRASVAYFHSMISDAIVREDATWEGQSEIDGKPVVRRVNASEAVYDGFELGARIGPFQGLSLVTDFAWVEGEVTLLDGTTEPPRREPPMTGLVGLRWDHPEQAGFHAGVYVRWAAAQTRLGSGDRKDLRICEDPDVPGTTLGDDCLGSPAWATVGLRAGFVPLEGLQVEAAVENLLDTNYRLHGSGYDAPGFDVRLTARYEL